MRSIVLAIALIALPASAGTIYKCEKDKKIIISDQPCEKINARLVDKRDYEDEQQRKSINEHTLAAVQKELAPKTMYRKFIQILEEAAKAFTK